MKLLPILLLTCALSLGVACSDKPTFSDGEAIGLVQGMGRDKSEAISEDCLDLYKWGEFSERYIGEGVWVVNVKYEGVFIGSELTNLYYTWRVHEGSNAIERGEGSIRTRIGEPDSYRWHDKTMPFRC